MAITDISPIHQGDLWPPQPWSLVDGTGAPINLTGVTTAQFTYLMRNTDTGQVTQGAGTFSITQPPTLGQVVYTWANPDTEVPGKYRVWLRWLMNSGAAPMSSDEQDLVIQGTF